MFYYRYLATGDSFRTISFSYRVGVSTVASIVGEVCEDIRDCLVAEFMPVPRKNDWRAIGGPLTCLSGMNVRRDQRVSKMHHVLGATVPPELPFVSERHSLHISVQSVLYLGNHNLSNQRLF